MLRLTREHADAIVAHALEDDPNECCGIVAGREDAAQGVFRITNTMRSPVRYLMDPQEFLNADREAARRGWGVIAFYHSHTRSPAYPSQVDLAMALQSGWLNVMNVIVSLENKSAPTLRAFKIRDTGEIVEEVVEIGERNSEYVIRNRI